MSRKTVDVEVRDASIATVSVTIKAVQVGKRQMTKAVFRQLPMCRLVDEESIAAEGDIWGWVNDQVPGQEPGNNFIVQRDGRLYRSPFAIVRSHWLSDRWKGPLWHIFICQEIARLATKRIVSAAIHEGRDQFGRTGEFWNALHDSRLGVHFRPKKVAGPYGDTHLIEPYGRTKRSVEIPIDRPGADRPLVVEADFPGTDDDQLAPFVKSGDVPPPGELTGRIESLSDEWRRNAVRWDALMDRIDAAEQLYISA